MNWVTVESSKILQVGYDEATSTLGIKFKPSKKNPGFMPEYHYSNVPVEMFNELVNAESIGRYFDDNIKSDPASYPYEKVD